MIEIDITCWEWEIIMREKEITIWDYRLVFLSRWATTCQRSAFLWDSQNTMAEQFEDLTGFFDSLRCIIERTASVYHASDLVGLHCKNLWKEARETHKNACRPINVTESLVRRTVWGVRKFFNLAVLLWKTPDILSASSFHQKEKTPLAFSASTVLRKTAKQYYKGNDWATAWDWNELEKYSNMPWNLWPNAIQTKDRVWTGKQFHRNNR